LQKGQGTARRNTVGEKKEKGKKREKIMVQLQVLLEKKR